MIKKLNILSLFSTILLIVSLTSTVFAGDTIYWKNGFRFSKSSNQNLFKPKTAKNYTTANLKGQGDDVGVPIIFSGEFRFNTMYRNLQESYPDVKPKNINIGGFGDGSMPSGASPLLTLYSKFAPAPGVDMGIGMSFNHIFSGSIDPDSTRSRGPFGQTFGVNATFKTRIGNIKVGGGNLYTGLSQMFSGWSTIRFNPFYRLPWDISAQYGGAWGTYDNIYKNGSITKFDGAYASGGRTQGVIVQFSEMPAGFGFNFSYGVNGQTGLFQTDDNPDVLSGTKKTIGGRLYKKVKVHEFALTGLVNNGFVDNISSFRETQYMYSGDGLLVFKNITLRTEIGATEFTSPFGKYNSVDAFYRWDTATYKSGIDYLFQLTGDLKQNVLGLPLHFNIYNLGPNYVNLNSGAFNTSTYNNAAAYIQINGDWDVAMRKGFIADVGQSTNNRRALELATQIDKGRFKAGIATQFGTEIQKSDTSNNQVMFYHHLNPWSRASYNFWTPVGGPYRKLLSNYIQMLERVPITDTAINYFKTFNVFNIDSRYKLSFLRRALILSNYISYQSVGDHFSPLPFVTDKAFVRVLYEELSAYYQLNKKIAIVGHGACNWAKGNMRTELSPTNGKPIDQKTWGIGAGLDWDFAPMMGFYFRTMYMNHKDINFELDHFKGFETTVELKVIF